MCSLSRMAVLFALIVCMPLFADDPPPEKKPDGPTKTAPKENPKPADAPKYQVVNKFVGKITKISAEDMKMTVEVQTVAPSSSGKKLKATTTKEEIKISGDVKVRALKLPERFDENNKPKPYTAEEKQRLKGNDPNLPGFAADLANIAVGQHVEISMGIRKAAPGSAKNKDKDVVPEKPQAILIVCTLEESASEKKK